jgi:uncharacterized protein (TIGR00369 family)
MPRGVTGGAGGETGKVTEHAVDPSFALRVRASFARQGVMDLFGAELTRVEPGRCVIRLAWRPDLTQQDGFFHAGVVTTIADSAAGYSAFTLMPATSRVLTVELKINLLAPARGEWIEAVGEVERSGRTLSVVRARVSACAAGVAGEVALLQATMMRLDESRA